VTVRVVSYRAMLLLLFCLLSGVCGSYDDSVSLLQGILSDPSGDICRLSLSRGADPNGALPDDVVRAAPGLPPLPPLHLAVIAVNEACTRYLLHYGANPHFWEATDDSHIMHSVVYTLYSVSPNSLHSIQLYRTVVLPFYESSVGHREFVVSMHHSIAGMIEALGYSSPLLLAVSHHDYAAVSLLVEDIGFSPDVVDAYGWPCLHIATWLDDPIMVQLLLYFGANPLQATPDGLTAAHVAVRRGNIDVLRELLDHPYPDSRTTKMMLQSKDKRGFSPVDLALLPPVMVSILLELAPTMSRQGVTLPVNAANHMDIYMDNSMRNLYGNDIRFLSPVARSTSRERDAHVDTGEVESSQNFGQCWDGSRTELPSLAGPVIETVSADDLSVAEFAAMFVDLHRPILITGNLTANMGIWRHTAKQSFVDKYGDVMFETGPIPYATNFGRKSHILTLSDFVDLMQHQQEGHGEQWIAFDSSERTTSMRDQVETPEFLKSICSSEDRLFLHKPQFSIGGKGAGAPLHAHVAAYNVVLSGYKRWTLFPPGELSRLARELESVGEGIENYSSQETWSEKVLFDEARLDHDLMGLTAVHVLQGPGSILASMISVSSI